MKLPKLTALRASLAPLLIALLATGCSRQPAEPKAGELPTVRFQTDWYAQAEHGGHYQAVAKGFYKEAGIEVSIAVGGPGTNPIHLVTMGQADFAMGRSDDLMLIVEQGVPVVMVCALMQRDPQGLLLHEDSPVRDFKDLDGRSVMAAPGANWINYIKARHKIDFGTIPMNYGIATFMADKNFIQQCFVTNEPFYARQNGAKPRTLLIADSGYRPYRIIYTSRDFAARHPERVRAFVAASIRGWDDFLTGDAAPGKALIASRNEKMSDEFMSFGIAEMNRLKLVAGDPAAGERTGLLTRARLQEQIDLLLSLGILKKKLAVEDVATFEFLPPELRALAEKS